MASYPTPTRPFLIPTGHSITIISKLQPIHRKQTFDCMIILSRVPLNYRFRIWLREISVVRDESVRNNGYNNNDGLFLKMC
jgi:hypothetical protein